VASAYPGALDSFATNKADATATATDHKNHHNDLADAINKIEAELGIDPSWTSATVKERIDTRDLKQSCRAASTGNVNTASPGATLDGVSLTSGDRVFLKDQTTPAQNGIYDWTGAASALTRSADSDTAAKCSDSMLVTVEQGTVHKDTVWELTTDNPITLGTTALRFTRISPDYVRASMPATSDAFQFADSIVENFTRYSDLLTAMAVGTLTSGTIRVFPMGVLRAGQIATGINMISGTTGATITGLWCGIARLSDRVVLARSNNSTANWTANAVRNFPFSVAYTPDKDEQIVGFIMAAATTMPTLYGVLTNNAVMLGNPVIGGNSNTGQGATPLAIGATMTAYTAAIGMPYAYLN
jgi:phage-related tail fiber protein